MMSKGGKKTTHTNTGELNKKYRLKGNFERRKLQRKGLIASYMQTQTADCDSLEHWVGNPARFSEQ